MKDINQIAKKSTIKGWGITVLIMIGITVIFNFFLSHSKWEYRMLSEESISETTLNQYGENGWELVSIKEELNYKIEREYLIIFKRLSKWNP